jgi:small subunit ribosomal protein S20
MANHKSALKRERQNGKRRLRNRTHKVRMRTFIRKFREAETAGDVTEAKAQLTIAVKLIDQTRSHGVIHRNAASRLISRLNKAYNKLEAGAAEA